MRWPGRHDDRSPQLAAAMRLDLMREILKTEIVRIKALIIVIPGLALALTIADLVAPDRVERVWHAHLNLGLLGLVVLCFAALEISVLLLVRRRLAQGRGVPEVRRYLSALIETSLPTLALAIHIDAMGPAAALGFATPLLYFLFIILSTLRLNFWLPAFTGFVAAAQLLAMATLYHPAANVDFNYHLVRSVILLVSGLIAGAVAVRLRRQFEASIDAAAARDRVTGLFGQHVSPQVVEHLLGHGAPEASALQRVTVMFVDFRSFTAQARVRSPQEVVDRLDRAFAVLVDILDRNGGIVNKFLGDGFLALFGAPIPNAQAVQHAAAAAREMIAAMARHNEAEAWPLRIGIGLHVGEVVAGAVGSPRRKEYTVMGDTVNFAARLEALNKELGTQCLVSAAMYEALGPDAADAVAMGEVEVRGYDTPLPVWRLG